jgi:phosphoribosylglycinamide formyltransferase-1
LQVAEERDISFIVFAGFMRILDGELLNAYAGRMLNLHPSLLPAFGGPGMFGEHVHRAVLEAGVAESGCTVHILTPEVDGGRILVQRRVPVLPEDSIQSLAERIHAEEHLAIVQGLRLLLEQG